MYHFITIDLAGEASRQGDIGVEAIGILRNPEARRGSLHVDHGAIYCENLEPVYLRDNARAIVGYLSIVELVDITRERRTGSPNTTRLLQAQ